MKSFIERFACRMVCSAGLAMLSLAAYADEGPKPFIPRIIISSTIPANGDLNPYGIAFVPDGFAAGGMIAPGDVLVSNFNAKNNLQGTGKTIIKLTPTGEQLLRTLVAEHIQELERLGERIVHSLRAVCIADQTPLHSATDGAGTA